MTAPPILEVRRLSKSFGALPVAQAIDLELREGARLGLIGPNGAGKTSFVNLLTGTLRADGGDIVLGGRDITHLKPERRVQLGLVRTHQINALLPDWSACDNVAIAVAERDHVAWRLFRYGAIWRRCMEEAAAQLAALGMEKWARIRVAELPYGEQRLLEIAIALTLKPRVLLLDEPAAGVPEDERHEILATVAALPSDVTVLLIEHDMDIVFSFADRISVLVNGALFVDGAPEEVARDPRVKAVYLGESLDA